MLKAFILCFLAKKEDSKDHNFRSAGILAKSTEANYWKTSWEGLTDLAEPSPAMLCRDS
jgi:hypothetical protein